MAPAAGTEPQRRPLFANVVTEQLHTTLQGWALVADVRANWGQVTVHMVEPAELAGLELSRKPRGFIFAMGCATAPTWRFTDGRQLTSLGREAAHGQLQRLVRNYEALRRDPAAVSSVWLRATKVEAELNRRHRASQGRDERREVRARFKRGELEQGDYQRRLAEARLRDREADRRHAASFQRVRQGFRHRTERSTGCRMDYDLTVRLLRLASIRPLLPEAVLAELDRV
jgi:hypothetical protein